MTGDQDAADTRRVAELDLTDGLQAREFYRICERVCRRRDNASRATDARGAPMGQVRQKPSRSNGKQEPGETGSVGPDHGEATPRPPADPEDDQP